MNATITGSDEYSFCENISLTCNAQTNTRTADYVEYIWSVYDSEESNVILDTCESLTTSNSPDLILPSSCIDPSTIGRSISFICQARGVDVYNDTTTGSVKYTFGYGISNEFNVTRSHESMFNVQFSDGVNSYAIDS